MQATGTGTGCSARSPPKGKGGGMRGGEQGNLLTMIATKLWAVKVVRNKIVVNLLTLSGT